MLKRILHLNLLAGFASCNNHPNNLVCVHTVHVNVQILIFLLLWNVCLAVFLIQLTCGMLGQQAQRHLLKRATSEWRKIGFFSKRIVEIYFFNGIEGI